MKLSGTETSPAEILVTHGTLDTETTMFTAAPEYRLLEGPHGSLDAMAGLRVWSVNTEVGLHGGLLGGLGADDGDTWVDPIIGMKGRLNLPSNFYLTGWGMVGGFGVSSDFLWDAWGGLGYDFNQHVSAIAGYRGTGVDYNNDDGFLFDVVQHGPVLGAVIRF